MCVSMRSCVRARALRVMHTRLSPGTSITQARMGTQEQAARTRARRPCIALRLASARTCATGSTWPPSFNRSARSTARTTAASRCEFPGRRRRSLRRLMLMDPQVLCLPCSAASWRKALSLTCTLSVVAQPAGREARVVCSEDGELARAQARAWVRSGLYDSDESDADQSGPGLAPIVPTVRSRAANAGSKKRRTAARMPEASSSDDDAELLSRLDLAGERQRVRRRRRAARAAAPSAAPSPEPLTPLARLLMLRWTGCG